MDFFKRLHPVLREEVNRFPEKHYFDMHLFENEPWKLQEQRLAFIENNPTPIPEGIIIEDIFIESSIDKYPIRLHVYKKKNSTSKKVVIYYHGGGYMYGLPEQADEFLFKLVEETGITIVAPCYRLAPQHQFPIPIQDGYDAYEWLLNNGEQKLNIDTKNTGILGASAGGHLAAAVSQKAVDNDLNHISLLFLLYPVVTNFTTSESMSEFVDIPFWNKTYADIAWQHLLGKDNVNKSVRYADLFNFDKFDELPRTIIITCELDPLRDEGMAYAQLLMKAKVNTELWNIPGTMHVFDRYKNPLADEYYDFAAKRLSDF
jgi:acetyl esterase